MNNQDDPFKQFLEDECEADFVSDAIDHGDADDIDGYELFYTFTSDSPTIVEKVHSHFESFSRDCGHSHDCCGCHFLQSIYIYRDIGSPDNYTVRVCVGRNT